MTKARQQIWTIGHSTRPLAEFLELLQHARIQALADVRRFPQSRRHPHFSRTALERSLAEAGIRYTHFESLGGHREPAPGDANAGLREAAFRGYADHMATREFADALALLETLAHDARTAVMCAEADPAHCHRSLLADALTARGWTVEHLVGGGKARMHAETHVMHPRARIHDRRVSYPAAQTDLLEGDERI